MFSLARRCCGSASASAADRDNYASTMVLHGDWHEIELSDVWRLQVLSSYFGAANLYEYAGTMVWQIDGHAVENNMFNGGQRHGVKPERCVRIFSAHAVQHSWCLAFPRPAGWARLLLCLSL